MTEEFAELSCTCPNKDCAFHPDHHSRGCTLCVAKNLRNRQIPSCFFQAVAPDGAKDGYQFEDFARLIQRTTPAGGPPQSEENC